MPKIHLRANKPTGKSDFVARAVCASKLVNGKVRNNSRSTYRYMASEIVSRQDFANVASADRCAHCMDTGLEMRNRFRKQNGMAPLATLFSDL